MSMKKSFGLLAITGVLLSTESAWAWGSRSANQTNKTNQTQSVRFSTTDNLNDAEIVNSDTDGSEIYSTDPSIDTYSSGANGVDKASNLEQNSDRNSIAATQNSPALKVERNNSTFSTLTPANTVATKVPTQQQDVFSSDVTSVGGRTTQKLSQSVEISEPSVVILVPPPLTQSIGKVRPVAKLYPVTKVRTFHNVIVNTVQPSATNLPVNPTTQNAPPTTTTAQVAIYPLLNPAPITSRFGWRTHPLTGARRFHSGVDIGAPTGTPVVATVSGTVVSAGWNGGYGKAVTIEQPDGERQTLYGHLSQISVQTGQWIEQGTVLGLVGSTGNSTGPHLHLEERVPNGDRWVATDPSEEIKYALDVLKRADPYARKDLPAGI
jgi:murein DD-endopeptidase MepM/ murein hydrolase activator NlpD